MIGHLAVDIGNSFIKWGAIGPNGVQRLASLEPDRSVWDSAAATRFANPVRWTAASVNPERTELFQSWVASRGEQFDLIDDYRRLPMKVDVDEPGAVGIDRLLAALAGRKRCESNQPAIVINAGTAITVDLLDGNDIFLGGAILPGPYLMAKSLQQNTAKLPLAEPRPPDTFAPAKNTRAAIALGIAAAGQGACELLIREYAAMLKTPPRVFLAGGAAKFFKPMQSFPTEGPYDLVLEGIRWVVFARRIGDGADGA